MNAIDQIEAEIRRQEEVQEYKGYKVADMRRTFEKLCDPQDWKAPIHALIPHQLFGLAAVAVEFFTCTELKVVGGPEPLTGRILVHADGYRMGPAGDQ